MDLHARVERAIAPHVSDNRCAQHIALILAGLSAGGAERVASLLSSHWISEGRRVTIITFDAPEDPVFHPIASSVRLIRLGIRPAGGVMSIARRVGALRRTLAELEPDIALSFLTKINVVTLLASLGKRRAVVISERNNPRRQRASRLWTAALAILQPRASTIVMQTEDSLECLGARARRRAVVIPNPILVHRACRDTRTRLVLAATGRLTWQKGFDLLIDAFTMVAARHPGWELAIWGEGEDRPLLEDQIRRLRMSDRIHLQGNSRSPDEWVAKADAFVLSSRYEGFPNALGEAMAAGLPVVAFRCAYGPAEMISPGEDGLLVPDGDVPALVVALDRLMGQPDLRRRIGITARATADRYRPDVIVRRWSEILDQAAARR